jgi:hypothetical protein
VILSQINILEPRMAKQRRDVLAIANDSAMNGKIRIDAHHLAAELTAAITRIYEGAIRNFWENERLKYREEKLKDLELRERILVASKQQHQFLPEQATTTNKTVGT